MAIFANVANGSRMNSLRMARPSRHDNVAIRKLKDTIKKNKRDLFAHREKNVSSPPRNRTISRGGDVQKDWMRWRQTSQAVLDLLTPEGKKRLVDAGVSINTTSPTGQAQYSPFNLPEFMGGANKTVTIRSGMSADAIRHELTHAGLDVASDMFSNVAPLNVFANTALGTFMGQSNIIWNTDAQMKAAESVAITMGGQEAYPGFTPTNIPQDFSQFFDVNHPSWQYPMQPGWNIK